MKSHKTFHSNIYFPLTQTSELQEIRCRKDVSDAIEYREKLQKGLIQFGLQGKSAKNFVDWCHIFWRSPYQFDKPQLEYLYSDTNFRGKSFFLAQTLAHLRAQHIDDNIKFTNLCATGEIIEEDSKLRILPVEDESFPEKLQNIIQAVESNPDKINSFVYPSTQPSTGQSQELLDQLESLGVEIRTSEFVSELKDLWEQPNQNEATQKTRINSDLEGNNSVVSLSYSEHEITPAATLDHIKQLETLGFTDRHFQQIHHFNSVRQLDRHKQYLETISSYQSNSTNFYLGERVAFILSQILMTQNSEQKDLDTLIQKSLELFPINNLVAQPEINNKAFSTSTEIPLDESDFISGMNYTFQQIKDAFGDDTGTGGFLPQKGNRIVCGMFRDDFNPNAPFEVLVVDLPQVIYKAELLRDQKSVIPVFIKHRVNNWEYVGIMRLAEYVTDTAILKQISKETGRTENSGKNHVVALLKFEYVHDEFEKEKPFCNKSASRNKGNIIMKDNKVNLAQISRFIGNVKKTVNFSRISKNINESPDFHQELNYSLPENYQFDEYAKKAYDALVNKVPAIFVTGIAGTGKTTFIHYVKNNYKGNLAILTSTGFAAISFGGQTIHSFFRFPPKILVNEPISEPTRAQSDIVNHLDLIIIEEISRVQCDLLDHIDQTLRKWKNSSTSFGGIQIMLVGDCLQVPFYALKKGSPAEREITSVYASPWFFEAKVFEELEVLPVELKTVYRQSDPKFINVLNKIRAKDRYAHYIEELNRLCYSEHKKQDTQIILTTTNKRADTINSSNYNAINLPAHVYHAVVESKVHSSVLNAVPQELELKVGTQVVVTKNIKGAEIGTLATVKSLLNDKVILQRLDNHEEIECFFEEWNQFEYQWNESLQKISLKKVGSLKQLPVKTGWAMTIHKSQGLTFDSVKIDLSGGTFAPGQTYVALTRCRTIEKLSLAEPISLNDIIIDPKVVKFYQSLFGDEVPDDPSDTENQNLTRTEFDQILRRWFSDSDAEIIGQPHDANPIYLIEDENRVFKLSQDTKRYGIKSYLDLLDQYNDQLEWSIVENANGRRNKAAFGPEKVVIPGFYLYWIDN